MTTTEKPIATLNSLLRGERSAVESYRYALSRFDGYPQEAGLRRLCDEHRQAVAMLDELVTAHRGKPSTTSGPWGYLAAAVTGAAQIIGFKATLEALKRGEEHGLATYNEALDNEDLPEDGRTMIEEHLVPRTRIHLENLQLLIAATG